MTLSEKLEAAVAQYNDAQQQLAWWQQRVAFLAGRVDTLQELLREEQTVEESKTDGSAH